MKASLLSKASFALLLLIFGSLVYIIVRDHRLEMLRKTDPVAQTRPGPATERAVATTEADPPPAPQAFAPLRPRGLPSSSPASASPVVASSSRTNAPPSSLLVGRDRRPSNLSGAARPSGGDFGAFAGTSGGTTGGSGGGTVTGQVLLRGTPPAEKQIVLDSVCGRLHAGPLTTRHYVTGSTGGLAEVFVYIKAGSISVGPPIAQNVVLDLSGCQFQPYIVGAQAGQTFQVRNSDPALHKVRIEARSLQRVNTLADRGSFASFVFPRREVLVRFKCDVHPWEFAYAGVVDHPWFAVTDSEGKFTLPGGLSSGRYTLAAVHPKAGELTQQITVSESGMDPVTFTFEVSEGATLSSAQ